MANFGLGGPNATRYAQRCKYCKTEMDVTVVGANSKADRELFNKTGPVKTCPRCDTGSPPIKPEVTDA